jgi:hypothetical protein
MTRAPSAGHLHVGVDKTLHRLRHEEYWVSMAGDVETYCRQSQYFTSSVLPSLTSTAGRTSRVFLAYVIP